MEGSLVSWIVITLNEEFAILDLETVKCLLLVSRSTSRVLKSHIQQHYFFDLNEEKRPVFYSPQRVRVLHCEKTLDSILRDILPPLQIKHLTFYNRIGFIGDLSEIPLKELPHTITNLKLSEYFNQHLGDLHLLLPNLTHLSLGASYNLPINELPHSLTHLVIGASFNHPINNLPINLQYLTLGHRFNSLIERLPHSLVSLTFGHRYNQILNPQNLPPNLQFLSLGTNFNFPIDNILPPHLKQLTLGPRYDHPIDHLPPNLTHLSLSDWFGQDTKCLPESISHLQMGYTFKHVFFDLPPKVTHLKFVTKYGKFNQYIPFLPASVKECIVPREYNQPINHLSRDVKFLVCVSPTQYVPYRFNPDQV